MSDPLIDDGTENSVEKTLIELVKHFSQPIHADTRGESALYFDERPMEPFSPVLQQFYDRLVHIDSQSVRIAWVCGYGDHIRPLLRDGERPAWNDVSNATTVLEHFELILARLCQEKLNQTEWVIVLVDKEPQTSLSDTIQLLAHDISLWTTPRREDDEKSETTKRLVSNQLLPLLLRILFHALTLYKNSYNAEQALRKCAVTLLAFGAPRLDPRHVSVAVEETLQELVCPLSVGDSSNDNSRCHKIHLGETSTWFDWTKVALDGTAWDDPVTEVATRAAQKCWEALLECLGIDVDNGDVIETTRITIQPQKRQAVEALGTLELVKLLRADFFGRSPNETTVAKRQPITYPLPPRPVERVKAYKEKPSLVHAVLQFVSLLEKPSREILSEVLPVCYELMETASYEAVGAAAVVHLLTMQQDIRQWDNLQETLVLILGDIMVRKGRGVIFVALAQSLALELFSSQQKEWRRKATNSLLVLTNVRRRLMDERDPEGTITGLLLCGVIPLLIQHANEPNADGLELGRGGLDALLPLLRWDGVPRIQIACLTALRYLFFGAYPIMPHHGGKIMCELLACLGHTSRCLQDGTDSKEDKAIRESTLVVGKHVAAVATVICGERARAVLDRVESGGKYEDTLVLYARDIRQLSDDLAESNQ